MQVAATSGRLHRPAHSHGVHTSMMVPRACSARPRSHKRSMQRLQQRINVTDASNMDTYASQVARAVKLPAEGPACKSIGDQLAVFAVSAVVVAGALEMASVAQFHGPLLIDLLRASLTGVATAALVKAMACLVGSDVDQKTNICMHSSSQGPAAAAAAGTTSSSQVEGQHALVLQQRRGISSTRSNQHIPTVIPEICWEVGEGRQLQRLQSREALIRHEWAVHWRAQLQLAYLHANLLRAVHNNWLLASSSSSNSNSTSSSNSSISDRIIASSSRRLALPPVGGSWATWGPLAASGSTLGNMLASSQLLKQCSHLAALPGAKYTWPRSSSSTRCPGARLPAGPLRPPAGQPPVLAFDHITPLCYPAGSCQPVINIASDNNIHSSTSASPLSVLPPVTTDKPTSAAAPAPYALLAAPAAPAALLPAAAASLVEVLTLGTFPSHPLLVGGVPSHPLVEEDERSNNILELPGAAGEKEGGMAPALVIPGGVATATRTLTTTRGTAQDKGRRAVQEDRLASGLLADGAVSCVGVFDGHAGSGVANSIAAALPEWLARAWVRDGTPAGFTAECVRLDNQLRLNRTEKSGSTAAVAMIQGTTLVTANVGDSSILLVKQDGSVVVLSASHNTLDAGELSRLVAAGARLREVPGPGGAVMHRIYDAAYINGLICSRSFGDFGVKLGGPGLTCLPHITTTQLDPQQDLAVVVVSDGMTDAFDPAVIGLTVSDALVMGCSAQQMAEELVFAASLSDVEDNMSAGVMLLSW